MTGIDVETTVPDSTATNMPTMRPEIAVKTSRAERVVSGVEGDVLLTVGWLLRRKLMWINDTPLVAQLQLMTKVNQFPALLSQIAMWGIVGYFTLGILMNAISRSRPERYTQRGGRHA
jgi:hypothetical protein